MSGNIDQIVGNENSLQVPQLDGEHNSQSSVASSNLPSLHTPLSRTTLMSDAEHTVINNQRLLKRDLQQPSAGEFNPGYSTWPTRQIGNSAAIGLACFALTAFIVGLYLAKAMGITIPNVVVAPAIFYGGIAQFLAGVCELIKGNTFAGTAFVSYGSFWLSFGAIYINNFGIAQAYESHPEQFNNAVGFFLLGWGIFTFMLLLVVLKLTWPFIGLFISLDFAFFMLAAGFMTDSFRVRRGGGILIVISAIFGWYSCFSGVSTVHNSYLVLPTGTVPRLHKSKKIPA
ncbi:hypothetical protein LELG_04804 [Lodderomyces elongisporus NRRL YB-4239]|uniref:Protein FUN34 n=1 Tax=Lodderomyces elongisporus (strain ATCC 11503 / CBS 2605 / JCM 1781 / NBRC 1676 / NRRL YB-4239) TaxID=379508 RepID=A5E5B5_LODEL|nr:hypothetical protein LELG_04804 [Lodderomyces elongisporus NRRL YB-4239]